MACYVLMMLNLVYSRDKNEGIVCWLYDFCKTLKCIPTASLLEHDVIVNAYHMLKCCWVAGSLDSCLLGS